MVICDKEYVTAYQSHMNKRSGIVFRTYFLYDYLYN